MNEFHEHNYRRFQNFAKPALDMLIDTSMQNPELIPEEGPCVIVSNHRSDIDPFIILVNVKRPINWMAASYLWNIPGFRQFLNSLGAIPISKYRSDIRNAFDRAADMLERGQAVGIFPEGWDYIAQNQFDWSVGDFLSGFARIAIETKSPVAPMALLGLDEIRVPQPFPPFLRKILDFPFEMQYIKDRCMYRKLHINCGRPIKPPAVEVDDRKAVEEFTVLVHDAVVDLYNAIPRGVAGFETITPSPAGPPKSDEEPEPELYSDEQADAEEFAT